MVNSLVFILALVGCGTKTTGNGTPIAGGTHTPTNSDVVDTEKTQIVTNETDEEIENEQQINDLSKTIYNIQPSAYYISTTQVDFEFDSFI